MNPILGYVDRPGFLHRFTATAKLVLVICIVVAAIIGFDTRFLAFLAVLNIILWVASKIKIRDLAVVLSIIGFFMVMNNLLIWVFSPEHGVSLFGSRTPIWDGPGRWSITQEQLFYQLNVTLKYFAVLPSVLLFITTTRPPEFASSLNRIGVPYKIAYAVALALRYIPDVQRDFRTISQAQQARGMDMSRKVGINTRIKNAVAVLMPLLLGSLDRIESVASAMELRGFGRGKKRTWYDYKTLKLRDVLMMIGGLLIVAIPIVLIFVNGGRFFNPFV